MFPVSQVIVHHTASPMWTRLKDVDAWHRENGFTRSLPSGLWAGYNILIERDGKIVEARGLHEVGQHSGASNNADSIGVSVVGDYSSGQRPDPRMWAALVSQCVDLVRGYDLPVASIIGHNEAPGCRGRVCPGFSMAELREAVSAAILRRSARFGYSADRAERRVS